MYPKEIEADTVTIPDQDSTHETLGYFNIVSEPPEIIYHLLRNFGTSPENLKKLLSGGTDRWVEQTYLAWQAVRHIHSNGEEKSKLTGFEPYFIGLGLDANAVAEKITQHGKKALYSIQTEHKHESGFMNRIYNNLLGKEANMKACQELDQILGMITGTLRGPMTPEAKQFQNDTYRNLLTRGLEYQVLPAQDPAQGFAGNIIIQRYSLPKLRLRPELEYPTAQPYQIAEFDPAKPYHFMYLLGRVGHPLFRELLR